MKTDLLQIFLDILPNILFFACAAACNAVMDTLQFRYKKSIFSKWNEQFWNGAVSWKNKYKDYDNGDERAKFPFAKTALVGLTDGWHLFQFLMFTFFTMAAVPFTLPFLIWLGYTLGLRLTIGLVFTLFFEKVFLERAEMRD